MANTNTDLTEEDAADLQFPKDSTTSLFCTGEFKKEALKTGAPKTGAFKTEAFKSEAFKTEAFKTEAFKTEAFKTEAFKTQTFKTQAFKTQAFKTEALKTEVFRTEALKTETLTETLKAETFKTEALPSAQAEVQSNCANCYSELNSPYILCVKCNINICSPCFAKGIDFGTHKSDHPYSVFKEDFVLFSNSDWTAKEELTLLEGLRIHRNWHTVAKLLPNRTPKDLEEHYNKYYLNQLGSPLLPKVPETATSLFPEPIVPYRFKITDVQDPPRYTPGTVSYSSVAGYNAARSDFEIKYDTNAEDLVANLPTVKTTDPDYNLMSELQCAIASIYNRRLAERNRRRRIIRDHGLIMPRKTVSWLHRYNLTITSSVYDRLVHFMQFYTGERFERMMEGLHRAGELKIQIARLCDFRKKGITTLDGAHLYMNLKQKHEENLKDLRNFQSNPHFKPTIKSEPTFLPSKKRSAFAPLEIIGMPAFDKLSHKEREVCRNVRLVPQTYFELKDILITENNKFGHLKLLTARRLLKIDVNKTRKLYDFLVQEGFVNKPK